MSVPNQEQWNLLRHLMYGPLIPKVHIVKRSANELDPPTDSHPRLACTLEGQHEMDYYRDATPHRLLTEKGEMVFFDRGAHNVNTNAKFRHVITFIFFSSWTQLNFVHHKGDPSTPIDLRIFRIEHERSSLSESLLKAMTEWCEEQHNHVKAGHLGLALVQSILGELKILVTK